jgi:hypothetical protein
VSASWTTVTCRVVISTPAEAGGRLPARQRVSDRARPSAAGRPRPWVAQDLRQQESGYLGGWPGDGGQGGLPPHRAGVADLAGSRARPVGSALSTIGSSLGKAAL